MIKDIDKEIKRITEWIRKYVEQTGAKGVIVGNSGGKDSATVIGLATKALGKEKVMTISMPCNSKNSDIEDAKLVSETFGVNMIEIDLSEIYEKFEKTIDTVTKGESKMFEGNVKEANINTKPRLRMTTLYNIAQRMGYLVIGTGNKCEAIVGYTTKWGDNACDFNPIGDFTVEEVLEIGARIGVPERIMKKAPSDGLGGLTDEEKLGVKYSEISEYIEKGKTNLKAMEIIKEKEKISKHKRLPIPVYKRI